LKFAFFWKIQKHVFAYFVWTTRIWRKIDEKMFMQAAHYGSNFPPDASGKSQLQNYLGKSVQWRPKGHTLHISIVSWSHTTSESPVQLSVLMACWSLWCGLENREINLTLSTARVFSNQGAHPKLSTSINRSQRVQ
jgi:hypothetical protein